MRPFEWYLKTHWKYWMPLDTPIPWNQKMIRHRQLWLDPQNVLQGEYLHPREHEKLIFTDASNALWGAHLDQNRRALVSFRKAPSHHYLRDEGGSSGSAILPDRLQVQSSPHRLRQHLRGGLYQQTGRHKVSRSLCSNVENPHLVSQKHRYTQSKTCSRLTQCDNGHSLKEEPDPINRVVPLFTDLQTNFQTLG